MDGETAGAPRGDRDSGSPERRWSPRAPAELPVVLRQDGRSWQGTARNLSLEGMFVETADPPAHGSPLEARLDGGAAPWLSAEVCHLGPRGVGLSLRFVDRGDFAAWRDRWGRSLRDGRG